jgi:hypothetical protein
MEVEEDWSNLSPEERKKRRRLKGCQGKRKKEIHFTRPKKFEEALAA